MADVDLMNRDPNNINEHIKCQYEDVLAEPEGVRSIDCVWSNAYKCFNCCLGLCYKIATLFCGICIAMELGCEFAAVAFNHVWCLTPCIKFCNISLHPCQRMLTICLDCYVATCCESLGRCLSQISVTKVSGGGSAPRGGASGSTKKGGAQQRLAF